MCAQLPCLQGGRRGLPATVQTAVSVPRCPPQPGTRTLLLTVTTNSTLPGQAPSGSPRPTQSQVLQLRPHLQLRPPLLCSSCSTHSSTHPETPPTAPTTPLSSSLLQPLGAGETTVFCSALKHWVNVCPPSGNNAGEEKAELQVLRAPPMDSWADCITAGSGPQVIPALGNHLA